MAFQIYQRRVQQQLPGVVQAAPVGAIVGRGVQQLGAGIAQGGAALFQIALKERERQDETAVQAAHADLGQRALTRQNSFKQLKGLSAIEGAEASQEAFRKDVEEVEEKLNNRQREKFSRSRANQMLSYRRFVTGHAMQQGEVHFDQSNAASLALADQKGLAALELVSKDLRDAFLGSALDEKKQLLMVKAKRKSWDKDITNASMLVETTKFHSAMIKQMAADKTRDTSSDVKEYLDQYGDEIEGSVKAGLTELVDAVGLRADVLRLADKINDKADERGGKKNKDLYSFDYEYAMGEARKLGTRERELVESEIDEHVRRIGVARRQNDTPILEILEGEILRGRSIKHHPQMANLSRHGQNVALRMEKAEKKVGEASQDRLDIAAIDMFESWKDEAIRRADVDTIFAGHGQRTRARAKRIQRDRLNDTSLKRTEFRDMVQGTVVHRGLEGENKELFEIYMNKKWNAAKGDAVKEETYNRWALEARDDLEIKGKFWDPDRKRYQVKEGETIVSVEEPEEVIVPPDVYMAIVKAVMLKEDRVPNKEEVEERYRKKMVKARKKMYR